MPKSKKQVPLPEGLSLGTNVRFYKDGWRVGRLDAWDGRAQILPIGRDKHIWVSDANVEPIEIITGSNGYN